MNKNEIKVILTNCLFNFADALVQTFVSVYLYVYCDSIVIMSIFTIIKIDSLALVQILILKYSKTISFLKLYIVGLLFIVGSAAYALFGSFLFEMSGYYILIAAVLSGIGEAFYYLSANTLNNVCTDIRSRAKFLSLNGICSNLLVLLSPIVANVLIVNSSNDMEGYKKILYISIAVYLIVIFVSQSVDIKASETNNVTEKFFSLKDQTWRDHQIATVIYAMLEAIFLILSGILIYDAAGNGDSYSKCRILFSAVLIIAYRFMPKLLKKQTIRISYIIGVTLNIFSILLLVWIPNIYSAIIFGVLHSLVSVFYDGPYSYISGNIIALKPEETMSRVAKREVAFAIGRTIGMGLIIVMYYLFPNNYLKISITILAITPIFATKILLKYK